MTESEAIVFVVDDDAQTRDALKNLMRSVGLQVEVFASAQDFLRSKRPDVPGCLVLDVRMPPTFTDEGLRAAIAVRAQRPGFPVLVLSQYVEQLYARELLASGEGAIGYLLKDRVSDVRQFIDGVRRVLEGGTDVGILFRFDGRTERCPHSPPCQTSPAATTPAASAVSSRY